MGLGNTENWLDSLGTVNITMLRLGRSPLDHDIHSATWLPTENCFSINMQATLIVQIVCSQCGLIAEKYIPRELFGAGQQRDSWRVNVINFCQQFAFSTMLDHLFENFENPCPDVAVYLVCKLKQSFGCDDPMMLALFMDEQCL